MERHEERKIIIKNSHQRMAMTKLIPMDYPPQEKRHIFYDSFGILLLATRTSEQSGSKQKRAT
jgi:hypothetical protein